MPHEETHGRSEVSSSLSGSLTRSGRSGGAFSSTVAGTVRQRSASRAAAGPGLLEWALALAALAALWPSFIRLAEMPAGRDRRYAAAPVTIAAALPVPTLPAACRAFASQAQTLLQTRLCSSGNGATASGELDAAQAAVLRELDASTAQAGAVLVLPLQQAQARLDRLRVDEAEPEAGAGNDVRAEANAVAAIEAELQPYIERFQLRGAVLAGDGAGPPALFCARQGLQAALRGAGGSGAATTRRADAALLYAAALDGHGSTAALAAQVGWADPAPDACVGGSLDALARSAAVLGAARQAQTDERKNEAMRALITHAGPQWAGAMALAYAFLRWTRRRGGAPRPAVGVAVALAAWAVAAYAARVSWPFGTFTGRRGFETARATAEFGSAPAAFVVVLLAAAALLGAWALLRKAPAASAPPQGMSTRTGFAGMVLLSGLGSIVLIELSANGHPVNRYLALYHQGHLWLGLLLFCVVLCLRQPLSRALGRGLARSGDALAGLAQRRGRGTALALLAGLTATGVLAFGLGLANLRQLTSEIGRVWLIVGAAWFFFLRGAPLAERLARAGPAAISVLRYMAPLLFVVGVLVGAMVVTRDMGPLLIAAYGCGAFVAASVAMWWHLRSGWRAAPLLLAVLLFAAWIAAVTAALFQLGNFDSVTAARLESLAAPFASTNDQAALVAWFQQATPRDGYGIGAVPWCGFVGAGRCSGVPAQIHSDYSFTAVYGLYGQAAAWAAALACALWLHRLVRHHGRVTRGEPRFVGGAGEAVASDGQALLSWMAVGWVALTLCQLAVTVAGNQALLPLTGVTFPFVSFGMSSLLVNLAFLALAIQVDLLNAGAGAGAGANGGVR